MRSVVLLLIPGLLLACATNPPAMSQQRLEDFIREAGSEVEGSPGALEFRFGGVRMACLSDPTHDRMRIIAAIASERSVSRSQLRDAMRANFHTALDARYATSQGVLYAAFIHPLSPLDDAQLRSALAQVASLVHTFGSSYSSGELIYGAPPGTEQEL